MIYVCAIVAAVGVFVIFAGRYKVMPEPICPNCRRRLENFEVERCPYCLLWMPPGLDRPRARWRMLHVIVGVCVVVFSVGVYAMSWAGVFEMLASRQATTAPATAPAAPALPPGMTPAQFRQFQAMGYITTSAPANLPAPAGGVPITSGTSNNGGVNVPVSVP